MQQPTEEKKLNLPKIRRSNEAMVLDLMRVSPYGSLGQAFIIEAIRYYSDAVAASEPEDKPGAIINPLAWKGIAEDVKARLAANYES